MVGMMLICVGILALIAGLTVRLRHRTSTTMALAVSRLAPRPLAQVAEHQRVRIDGLAVAAETDRLLVAPCSGLPALWFRVRVHRIVGATGGEGGSTLWQVGDEWDHRTRVYAEFPGRCPAGGEHDVAGPPYMLFGDDGEVVIDGRTCSKCGFDNVPQ